MLIYVGSQKLDNVHMVETQTLSDTVVPGETAVSTENVSGNTDFQNDNEAKDILQNSDDEAVNTTELEEQAFAMAEGIENSEGHDDTSIEENESDKTITDETESEKTAIDETDTEKTSDYEFSEDRIDPKSEAEEIATAEKPNFSETNLIAFMKDHPDVVGWIYFEDGHISYPIVHSEDNEEYRTIDYDRNASRYGAIFLDYRSSGDFTDANSIVYGHNMKDGSMFGSLRAYRQDPTYYNDHQYFQIITPDKTYRYLIFEYMDVPENYVLYDYVAEAALSFVADAEPVRIKSYMDSDIVVNKDSKVVTLSTCTRKDDLQFVVLGVLVDETAD